MKKSKLENNALDSAETCKSYIIDLVNEIEQLEDKLEGAEKETKHLLEDVKDKQEQISDLMSNLRSGDR